MKAKVTKNKNTNEMRVEYYKVFDEKTYRYTLINLIMQHINLDIMIYIDTNQNVKEQSYQGMFQFFHDRNLKYEEMCTTGKGNKMFGVAVGKLVDKKKKRCEKMMVFEMTSQLFTKEFFDQYLINVDIAIGIGRKHNFYVVCEKLLDNADEVLFNTEYFEDFFMTRWFVHRYAALSILIGM